MSRRPEAIVMAYVADMVDALPPMVRVERTEVTRGGCRATIYLTSAVDAVSVGRSLGLTSHLIARDELGTTAGWHGLLNVRGVHVAMSVVAVEPAAVVGRAS